jgi:hypothetical protein
MACFKSPAWPRHIKQSANTPSVPTRPSPDFKFP